MNPPVPREAVQQPGEAVAVPLELVVALLRVGEVRECEIATEAPIVLAGLLKIALNGLENIEIGDERPLARWLGGGAGVFPHQNQEVQRGHDESDWPSPSAERKVRVIAYTPEVSRCDGIQSLFEYSGA